DVMPESGECMSAGRTCIDHCSRAFCDAVRIRGDAEWGDAVVYMNMNVNQSGCNDHLPGVENLARFGFRNVCRDACDFSLADRNIGFRGETLRWVDHATSTNQEI